MKADNRYLTALGWASVIGLVGGAVFYVIGLSVQADAGYYSDGDEGLVPIAIGTAAFQFGAGALLLWLAVSAIVHQLAYAQKPAELTEGEAGSS